ncbi:CPBP family intramembrane metalloprotease [Paenibacillus oenotherae]|uniref:CPBP family intramembrane metalloprotease n=1 Tax=Paenibacillus oenotherae TaxID=1435645 RepID=A0ABS7D3S3_9BACL|nr:CPBP family intramembrane glutamic endopeptidase [Paenibacillus oenotherae]MBW7474592.1 CPBP family intramembrane metalloprotease [Paenibacillus oenotherae]
MNQLKQQPNWTLYSIFAAIGIVIYLVVQVLPSTAQSFFDAGTSGIIAKSAAEEAADEFVQAHFGQKPASTHAIHQSNQLLYGYLSKEKLFDQYGEKYDDRFPTDTFQVNTEMPDDSKLFIYVHMETGKVVSWNRYRAVDTDLLGSKEQFDAAMDFAEEQGFQRDALKTSKLNTLTGAVWLEVKGAKAGEAPLILKIRSEKVKGDQSIVISEYKPTFKVPEAYESYVDKQTSIGLWLSIGGSMFLSFVLFVLAIIYAAIYRKHTSFKRGILLTVIFLGFYMANNFNMMDGILAELGEQLDVGAMMIFNMAFTAVVTVLLAAAVYFSVIGGDGLWRSMGRRLWPRSGEAGYGDHVWRSMWLGYLAAFSLLGLQTVIFIVWNGITGAWSTSDVTQSPYNLAAPWLFPVLAWCAAISEEAVFRLFGIGLMKRWFKNTFVAALIPTIIWALGHVTYPIFPATTRLVELTILGLLFSFLFLRYGFIMTVFTHAIFNSVMMAISLMFMGSFGNILWGIFYIVLPIPIAWLIRMWDRRIPDDKRKQPVPVLEPDQAAT